MKKFKEFVDEPIRVDEPINFKGKYQVPIKIDEPINFKGKKASEKPIKEDAEIKSIADTTKRLRERAKVSDEHKKSIKDYTKDSADLNRGLAKGSAKDLSDHHKAIHKAIHASKHEAGEHLTLHSGVSARMGKRFLEHRGKVFHSPAHMSATHDHEVAKEFMHGRSLGDLGERHIVHIHVKPKDKILHVSHHSASPEEHESIVPSGTHLKHVKTHSENTADGDTIVHHHFEIHHQEG